MATGSIDINDINKLNWRVTLADTGLNTMTGGRLKKMKKYIGNDTFLMSYGDGLSDVNIRKLIKFHKSHGKMVTVTVHPGTEIWRISFEMNCIVKRFEKSLNSERMD